MRFPARLSRSILAVLLLIGSLIVGAPDLKAQSSTVDPVFGGAGLGLAGDVDALALQADGKVLVIGGLNQLARLNSDGTTDYGFDPVFDAVVRALAVQADGRIVVAGSFTHVNGMSNTGLVRLNADGTTDVSFNANTNPAIGPEAATMALQSDGKILIGGYAASFNGVKFPGIVRLNTDGSVDTSFNAGISGDGSSSCVNTIIVEADGSIVINGVFSKVDGASCKQLARLNPDGTLDTTFNPAANGGVLSLAVQSDGQLIVGGKFTQIGGVACNGLARLNPDGSVDTSFSYTGEVAANAEPFGDDLVVEPNGQIVFEAVQGTTLLLIRVNADGSVDPTFSVSADEEIYSMLAQADGTLIVGGLFSEVDSFTCNSVARLNPDGSADTNYLVDVASGPNGPINCLAVQADGSVLIGGTFTTIDGAAHNYLARLTSAGTPDATFNADVVETSESDIPGIDSIAVQSDGKILVAGTFNQIDGVARENLARLNVDGSLDTTFTDAALKKKFKRALDGVVLQVDGGILVFGDGLARLNADGSLDTGFTSAVTGFIVCLAIQADGKILVPTAPVRANGAVSQTLLRLNTDGSVDASFNASFSLAYIYNGVDSLAEQADGKIVAGGVFTAVNGAAVSNLVRLNSDGSVDTSFSASVQGGIEGGDDDGVNAIIVEADGTIVVGGRFTMVNGQERQGLAHLNADGSLDLFTGNETGVNFYLNALAQQPDGRVLLGGDFTSVDGVQRNYVARLTSGGTPDFFGGGVSVGGGFYYLQFPDGTPFGYYNLAGNGYAFPYFFHADLGMEYFFDANDGQGGIYLYDFASSTFFYTSPVFPWPYLYDFTLNSVLYYYPDPNNPGHYNIDGVRSFYDFNTGTIISK